MRIKIFKEILVSLYYNKNRHVVKVEMSSQKNVYCVQALHLRSVKAKGHRIYEFYKTINILHKTGEYNFVISVFLSQYLYVH